MTEPYSDNLKPKHKRNPQLERMVYIVVGLLMGVLATGAIVVVGQVTRPPDAQPTQFPLPTLPAQAIQPTVIAKHISSIGLSGDGTLLGVTTYEAGTVQVQLRPLYLQGSLLSSDAPKILSNEDAQEVLISPNNQQAMTVSASNHVRLYDIATNSLMRDFESASSASFSADGTRIALGGVDGTLQLLDAQTMQSAQSLKLPNTVIRVAFSGDGQSVAAAYVDTATIVIGVWNVNQLDQKPYEYVAGEWVYDLAFSPQNHLTVATDSNLLIIDPQDASTRFYPLEQFGRVRNIAWSPDGKWFAACGGEVETGLAPVIYVWQWDTSGTLNPDPNALNPHILLGHEHNVNSITFTPDSQYLLSAGDDGSIRMWRTDTWQQVSEIRL